MSEDQKPLLRVVNPDATPEEVAAAVSWLCSSESAWMTGEVMDLNGGAHTQRYPDLLGHVNRMLGVS